MSIASFVRKELVGILACTLAIPATASGQRGFEIGPLIALYAPLAAYDHTADFFRVGTPERPSDNRGSAWGGEARYWVNQRVGVQLQAATSSVDHPPVFTPASTVIATTTRMSAMTAQVLYGLSPVSSIHFWMSGGGGFIRHAGTAYEPYGSPTQAVGALGLGSTIALPLGLGASVGVTSLLYRWDLSDSRGVYQRGLQTDMLAHAGLTLSLR
jgi:hypothetical protein